MDWDIKTMEASMRHKLKEVIFQHAIQTRNGMNCLPEESFEKVIDDMLSITGDMIIKTIEEEGDIRTTFRIKQSM